MKKKYAIICGIALMISCSDMNDYNTEPIDSGIYANKTLWENIAEGENTLRFAEILDSVGYASVLQSSIYYTVWAPIDGSYNADSLLQIPKSDLLDQFVENHIAIYGYDMGSQNRQKVMMLNGKSFELRDGLFDGISFVEKDIPAINGVLNTLDGTLMYRKNIYDYIMTEDGIDSIKAYYQQFEETTLDEENSILGPIVNGKQTYIDSVMITNNTLFSHMKAYINVEDSDYTALIPTDEAWIKTYERIKPYFSYATKTVAQDLSSEEATPTITKTIDKNYYTDELTKQQIVENIFFNNNSEYNAMLRTNGNNYANNSYLHGDTLRTTTGSLLSNGTEMFSQGKFTTLSNGQYQLVDTLPFLSRDTWAPTITVSATSSTYRPRLLSATASTVNLEEGDINLEKGYVTSYADIVPTGAKSLPDLYFYLPSVLSTTYEIYIVILPASIRKGNKVATLPNKFTATLTYSNTKGSLQTLTLGEDFVNDTSRVDTMLLGTVDFPVCYRNLSDCYPTLEIKANLKIFNSTEMSSYDREMRIASVIMKPKEE